MVTQNTEQKEHKKFMAKIRKKSFPIIFKNNNAGKNGILYIVYKNRVEQYEFKMSESKKDIDEDNGDCCYDYEEIYGKGWNAYHEIEMLKNNGFKRVKDTEKDL